jgi:RNA polymerase sigma-70 factor (sigma-E family)
VTSASESGTADLAGLFRRCHADLVRMAVFVVGDRPTAEDVVQDVYSRLHTRHRYQPGELEPLAYVRAAVLNGCRSQLRRRAVAQRFTRSAQTLFRQATQESAEQEVLRIHERDQILAALATLPVRMREVLVLRYYAGLSEAEIATVLGISPGTVKSRAARGLATLARKLGESE